MQGGVVRAIGAAVLALAILAAGSDARAAGAVAFQTWDGGGATVSVGPGESAAATTRASLASSMANNPALNGSAWAHTGGWWNLFLDASDGVSIRVSSLDPAALAPGLSVWASGASVFDGGTTGFGGEISSAGFGTPHSFNAYGPLGDAGTLWMQTGQGGNMQELLGYAISGPSFMGATGWGESILTGAHGLGSGSFASSVSGSAGPGFAELVLGNVQAGWYTIYVGGTNASLSGGQFDLGVASLPEPGSALLLAVGLAAAVGLGRRR